MMRQLQQAKINELDDEESSSSTRVMAVVLSNLFLFFLVFGLSATVSVDHLKHQLHNRKALLTGIGMQFICMPLLGFATVKLLELGDTKSNANLFTNAMGMSLLVVTSSPGGSYSNWWCSLFNADLALSVAMTSISTLLSVGMLPANLMLYSHLVYKRSMDHTENDVVSAIDFPTLFISLGIVMSAILSGLFTSYKIRNPTFQRWANRGASLSGIALVLVSALLSSVGTETNFWTQPWKFYVGVAMPCLGAMLLTNLVSRSLRLPRPECMSISIECCYQNTGIATSVAVTMFSNPEERAQALAVPLFYGVVEAAVILIYCLWAWKAGWSKASPRDPICTVIGKSYEVEEFELELEQANAAVEAIALETDVLEVSDNQYCPPPGPGPDTPGKQGRPTSSPPSSPMPRKKLADDDLDDLPRIMEEEDVHKKWWQFWKSSKRNNSTIKLDVFDMSPRFDEEAPKYGLCRTRLASEDNTVATGITDRPRTASDEDAVAVAVAAATTTSTPSTTTSTSITESDDDDPDEARPRFASDDDLLPSVSPSTPENKDKKQRYSRRRLKR